MHYFGKDEAVASLKCGSSLLNGRWLRVWRAVKLRFTGEGRGIARVRGLIDFFCGKVYVELVCQTAYSNLAVC